MIQKINPTSPTSIRRTLQEYGIRPSKRLGQNFLTDLGTVSRIISLSGLQTGDICLEIGPGLGALTSELAQVADRVVAVEVDGRLVEILRSQIGISPNIEILHADFLKWDIEGWLGGIQGPIRVVANIPYSITTPIIEALLTHKDRLKSITLLVQKEVAERITAAAGSVAYSSLSVYCAYHSDPRVVYNIGRHLFVPVPDVDSAVLTLTPRPSPLSTDEEARFFTILKAAFQQRRKTVGNSLSVALSLPKQNTLDNLRDVGINPSVRAETLHLDAFIAMARGFDIGR